MGPITSTANPRVRGVVALHRRRGRRDTGRHLAEGPTIVREAARAGAVETVFGTAAALAELLPGLVADGIDLDQDLEVVEVADHVLERMADAATPQGVVAVARTPSASLDDVAGRGVLAVLDAVADPGNAGTIVRTADAAGASGVVLTRGSVDAFAPKTVRAASGSTYHLPVVTDVDLASVVAACRTHGQTLLGLDAAGARSVFDLGEIPAPLALVLGNEAHGLDDATRRSLDGTVAIPIHGRAESLNVAAAAAVALYAAAMVVHTPDG
jgi:TrmH family RNA methyltransferase